MQVTFLVMSGDLASLLAPLPFGFKIVRFGGARKSLIRSLVYDHF
jgi:hypothetical protein